jgi:hypothetical protein
VGRKCTVCAHPERQAIDKALLSHQEKYRDIALRFSLNRMSLWRHRDDHLPLRLVEAQAATDVRAALDVVKQLEAINGAALRVLTEARTAGDGELALKAIDRIQRQIELQAKLLGELDERPQINITVHPEFVAARVVLLRALLPYPDARTAAAEALLALDQGDGGGRRN